jgi:F-type H+-transporting ATPase subunit delta
MIARKYARALLSSALKENAAESVKKEIDVLSGLMKQKKYFNFFASRSVRPEEKLEIFSSLSPLMKAFLRVVIDNKREEDICLISCEYAELLNLRNNVLGATVSSKAPLTDEQMASIKRKLARSTGKKIDIGFKADRSIIGGVKIKYGSKVMDGTVSGMLEGYLDRLTRR